MRVFAAVWPPDEVLDHLDLALAAVRGAVPGDGGGPVRWSAREAWHLTCAFYGQVPDGSLPELTAGLAAAAAGATRYDLRLRGAGVFSHRTLWIGVGGDTAAQQALARAAVAAGEAVGARSDDRPRERAHLTIGRARTGFSPRERRGRDRDQAGMPAYGRPGDRRARELRGGDLRGVRSRRDAAGPASFDPESVVAALAVYEGPEWTVDALRLVASRPGEGRGGGPLYTTVEEFPLGTPADGVAP